MSLYTELSIENAAEIFQLTYSQLNEGASCETFLENLISSRFPLKELAEVTIESDKKGAIVTCFVCVNIGFDDKDFAVPIGEYLQKIAESVNRTECYLTKVGTINVNLNFAFSWGYND